MLPPMKRFFAWLEKRRARRFAALRRAARAHPQPIPQPENGSELADQQPLSVHAILAEIERNELERARVNSAIKLAELQATAEERREERDYKRAEKEKERTRRAQQSQWMREQRQKQKNARTAGANVQSLPPFAATCEDCRARLENRPRNHTQDMIRHAQQQHELLFQQQANGASS